MTRYQRCPSSGKITCKQLTFLWSLFWWSYIILPLTYQLRFRVLGRNGYEILGNKAASHILTIIDEYRKEKEESDLLMNETSCVTLRYLPQCPYRCRYHIHKTQCNSVTPLIEENINISDLMAASWLCFSWVFLDLSSHFCPIFLTAQHWKSFNWWTFTMYNTFEHTHGSALVRGICGTGVLSCGFSYCSQVIFFTSMDFSLLA